MDKREDLIEGLKKFFERLSENFSLQKILLFGSRS